MHGRTAPHPPTRSTAAAVLLGPSAAASAVAAGLYATALVTFERWWVDPVGVGTGRWETWRLADAAATSFELTAGAVWVAAVAVMATRLRRPSALGRRGRWWLAVTAMAAAAIALGHVVQPDVHVLADPTALRVGYGLRFAGHAATAAAMVVGVGVASAARDEQAAYPRVVAPAMAGA